MHLLFVGTQGQHLYFLLKPDSFFHLVLFIYSCGKSLVDIELLLFTFFNENLIH